MKTMSERVCLFVMCLSMLLLTACGDITDIKLNEDGTGSVGLTLMIQEEYDEYYPLGGSVYVKQLEAMGFVQSKETYESIKYVSFKKSVEFNSTDKLKNILTKDADFGKAFFGSKQYGEDMSPLYSCVVNTNTFQGVYAGTLDRFDIAYDDDEDEEMEVAFTRLSITFPNEIVHTNGKKDGKTAIWLLEESLNDQLLQATTAGKEAYPKDTTKPVIHSVKNGVYYRDDVNVSKVTFYVDQTEPTVTGVANKKYYNETRTIKFSDKYGVKTATLNGNSFRSGKKVSAPEKYTVRVTDKTGNIRTVRFTIKK